MEIDSEELRSIHDDVRKLIELMDSWKEESRQIREEEERRKAEEEDQRKKVQEISKLRREESFRELKRCFTELKELIVEEEAKPITVEDERIVEIIAINIESKVVIELGSDYIQKWKSTRRKLGLKKLKKKRCWRSSRRTYLENVAEKRTPHKLKKKVCRVQRRLERKRHRARRRYKKHHYERQRSEKHRRAQQRLKKKRCRGQWKMEKKSRYILWKTKTKMTFRARRGRCGCRGGKTIVRSRNRKRKLYMEIEGGTTVCEVAGDHGEMGWQFCEVADGKQTKTADGKF